jgi:hypothetical protein
VVRWWWQQRQTVKAQERLFAETGRSGWTGRSVRPGQHPHNPAPTTDPRWGNPVEPRIPRAGRSREQGYHTVREPAPVDDERLIVFERPPFIPWPGHDEDPYRR